MLARRSFLKALAGAALVPSSAHADENAAAPNADVLASRNPPDLDVLDLAVEGDKALGRRFTLYIPKHLAPGEKVPLLLALHGLGETWDQGIGVHAWVQRYGLGNAYARLRRAPVARTSRNKTLLPDALLGPLNASLAARPFKGIAIACPFTPNVAKQPDPSAALDAYASWIADVVLPRARKEAPVVADAAHTSIDGVSLGGLLAMEVFIRKPDLFGAWGGVQSAFVADRLPHYVEKIAAALAKRPAKQASLHIETSTADPMFTVNSTLSRLLAEKGIANDFEVLPGFHDQLFLREAGGLHMLLWHDRRPR